jgi:hypothetical protein
MHVHAIGVSKGVTLMEFERTCQEVEEPAQKVQPIEPEASKEVVLECPRAFVVRERQRICNFHREYILKESNIP